MENIIVTKCNVPRALEPLEFKKVFEKYGINAALFDNSSDAVTAALSNDGVCAVCGSLYLIGEVRKAFKS